MFENTRECSRCHPDRRLIVSVAHVVSKSAVTFDVTLNEDMKLAIVTELFSPSVGGQEIRYLEMGRELVRAGHQVDVYTIKNSHELPARDRVDGISVFRVVDGPKYQSSAWGARNPADVLKLAAKVVASRRSLQDYDVVLFNKWPILPQVCYRFLAGRSRAIVDWCEVRSGRLWDRLYRLFATNDYRHIAVASHISECLVERFGLRRDRVRVVVSGINTMQYASASSDKLDKRILFFGRMADHKNPILLLEAFTGSVLAREGYTLDVAGGGPLLEEARARFGSSEGVRILGPVSDAEKVALLKRATLLVLPSRREGFPRVVAEAAAAGTPSLTTLYPDNGTAAVVAEYDIGWACDPNAASLADAIRRRGAVSGDWAEVSERCGQVARAEFDWAPVCEKFLTFASE
jgi:glycosyltransferase involved in cell wall biosynthesis